MIRILITLLNVFIFISCLAQQGIEVKYAYKPTFNVEKSGNELIDNTLKSAELFLPNLPFVLKANAENSSFRIEKGMSVDESNKFNLKLMLILTELNAEIFNDVKTNITTIEKEYSGEKRRLENEFSVYKWQIHNQEKIILGYTCQKATTYVEIKTRSQEIINRKVTAWFCKSLPYPFGPTIFRGLPGLILEVHYDHDLGYILKAENIELIDKTEVDLPNKKVKIITQEEIEKRIQNSKNFFGM